MMINNLFSDEQIAFIKKLNLDIDIEKQLSDDEIISLTDIIGDELIYNGLDKDYYPNEKGKMCESILDILGGL